MHFHRFLQGYGITTVNIHRFSDNRMQRFSF